MFKFENIVAIIDAIHVFIIHDTIWPDNWQPDQNSLSVIKVIIQKFGRKL